MKKNYFDTEALATHPPKDASSLTPSLIVETKHAQRPTRTVIPVVAFGALVVALFISIFALGFFAGSQLGQPETRQAGQVFDKEPVKLAGPVFVKVPEELP